MFEDFYASFWQHPLLLWIAPLAFLFVVPRRWGRFEGYLWLFTIATILDPLCTGPLVGWFALSSRSAAAVMILFVLLGDFRFFFVTEALQSESIALGRGIGRAAAWTFVVPSVAVLLLLTWPTFFDEARHLFLAYEVAFFCLAAAMRWLVLPRRDIPAQRRRWLMKITGYAMLYYALWATADVVILAGLDWGFAIRVVPNVLYYGLFLPFVYWTAPDDMGPLPRKPDGSRRAQRLPSNLAVSLVLGVSICACANDCPEERSAPAIPAATAKDEAADIDGELTFVDDTKKKGNGRSSVELTTLASTLGGRKVDTRDPYYGRQLSFMAWPARSLIEAGFGATPDQGDRYSLEASDGYQVELTGSQLADARAFFAYHDTRGDWEPIGERQAHPGPLYFIWSGQDTDDLHAYPRPWGIVRVRKLGGTARFVHLRPPNGFPTEAAASGHGIFVERCVRCHSLNGDGGKVGPELNVPRNILEYRDAAFVRAFVKNPRQFRYSAMPAHPDLNENQLDQLLAYLRTMGQHKHDDYEHAEH